MDILLSSSTAIASALFLIYRQRARFELNYQYSPSQWSNRLAADGSKQFTKADDVVWGTVKGNHVSTVSEGSAAPGSQGICTLTGVRMLTRFGSVVIQPETNQITNEIQMANFTKLKPRSMPILSRLTRTHPNSMQMISHDSLITPEEALLSGNDVALFSQCRNHFLREAALESNFSTVFHSISRRLR